MKKTFILILLIVPLLAYSQRFKGGLMAGMNASQIQGDSFYGYNKAGLMGGVYILTEFTDKWAAQMEIKYSEKGSSTPKDYSYKMKFRLSYIEMPLLARFEIIKHIQLQGGISLGYLFYAGQNDGNGYERFNEMPSRIETAVCGGINFTYFDRFDLNLRYSYSLIPVYENYAGATYGDGKAWFNDVITFGIYLKLGQ